MQLYEKSQFLNEFHGQNQCLKRWWKKFENYYNLRFCPLPPLPPACSCSLFSIIFDLQKWIRKWCNYYQNFHLMISYKIKRKLTITSLLVKGNVQTGKHKVPLTMVLFLDIVLIICLGFEKTTVIQFHVHSNIF